MDQPNRSNLTGKSWLRSRFLEARSPPRPDWWTDEYVSVASELETGTAYEPRGGSFRGYSGPLWRFAQERLAEANGRHLSVRDARDGWHSGAFLLETVPSVLSILARHGHEPEEAIVRAVNDTMDNDTIAAIVKRGLGRALRATAPAARGPRASSPTG